MAGAVRFCAACGRSLARAERFCGACGTVTLAAVRAARGHRRAESARARRATAAMAWIFAGTLVAMLVVAVLPTATFAARVGALLAAEAVVGAGALAILGFRRWRASLGRWPSSAHLVLALPAAAASLAFAWAWIGLLLALAPALPDSPPPAGAGSLAVTLLLLAFAVPVIEEWLCRGLLWTAVRPMASRGVTVVVTAALFALLHGLNGLYLLEVPHRFVAGLVYGWLRDRSGSLLPGCVAHALHNAVAVTVPLA